MQVTEREPVRLYCPTDLRLDEMLDQEDRRFGDAIVYLCHAIMTRRVEDSRYRKGHNDGWVRLKAQYLQRIVGRHNWEHVKHLAVGNGVVECNESYFAGTRAKGYRMSAAYAEDTWGLREVADNRLLWRLQRWWTERERAEWKSIESNPMLVSPEVCKFLYRELQRCGLRDDAPVDQFAPEVAVAVDKIRRGDWFFHRDQFGRIHTNLSNIKRELRRFLLVDGQRLVNVDIANSQPLFIGMASCSGQTRKRREGREEGKQGGRQAGANLYVRQAYVRQAPLSGVGNVAVDLRRYMRLCEAGQLYQFVQSRIPKALDYDTLKQRVLSTLYDRDSHRNAVYRVLDEHFPSLVEFARHVKRKDYRQLAHLAQRVESRFMFEQVVPRLMRERPGLFVASIHDSLLVPRGTEEYVREVMLAEFQRLGVSPTVRIET